MELAWLNKIYTCSFVATAAMLVSFHNSNLEEAFAK
ncbi:hypothetical protein SAMN05444380_11121 [Thermophagus xiamenensis]|uniref:Uncharacterized protein n=1 Tax=Thermophagus xiamenensis TaxID=385682 RepID=A0A1I2ABJ5_9BACT|nr:hypothetical protein SAMN05444380_11121 [Thermophagus xiamenensis]